MGNYGRLISGELNTPTGFEQLPADIDAEAWAMLEVERIIVRMDFESPAESQKDGEGEQS